ncbi:MAG: FAD-binding oxidoreductase [Myxococcota bacterium]
MFDPLATPLREWRAALGDEHVLADGRAYEQCTFAHDNQVNAVLRPGSVAEVQALVRIAAEYRVPLYPISRGRNWGYGSRAPTADAVVVDLGRLDEITAYDEDLACVTVQPGVTQQQLVDFLAERGGRHWADTTSVSPDSSVLGNIVERGHGLTPYADHVDCVGSLEVVLGDGQKLETGHARFGASGVAGLDRFTAGPSLQGLFTQSSLGIVTAVKLWLMPAPEASSALLFDPATDEELLALIPVLRQLRLQGTIASGPRFANVFRGLMFGEYPWDRVEPGGVLRKETALELARDRGRGAWRVSCAVHGPRREVEARAQTVFEAVAPLLSTPPIVFDPSDPSSSGATADNLEVLSTLLTGGLMPGGAASIRTYWRKKARPEGLPDPDRDRCGVLWLAPVTPFRAADVRVVQSLVEEVLPRHGFEPDLSMYCLRARALHYHISIMYDRDRPGADAAAKAAHDELLWRFLEHGYPPHRLGLQSMVAMDGSSDVHATVLNSLKRALDPAQILAPRRYHPKP